MTSPDLPRGPEAAIRTTLELFRKQCVNKEGGIGFEETVRRLLALNRLSNSEADQAVTTALQQVADGLPEEQEQRLPSSDEEYETAHDRFYRVGGFNFAINKAHQAIATVKKQWEKTND